MDDTSSVASSAKSSCSRSGKKAPHDDVGKKAPPDDVGGDTDEEVDLDSRFSGLYLQLKKKLVISQLTVCG